eukprot:CAMPEP_0201699700 /NCGR_PEP_ID=MMETSP0578-20130828/25119_1 /ASSEMBLY_ACC=CAM_ASM_000663 /TAXON_ID=267565 /ORGANISM="Skeletonema grethea, Strain CCMP 1804" /LENGTH=612 /DNA_ID=CAMNT_0048186533 /DNA_START=214 /DNA_END=2052 /DNA_ORIENTATION=-
MDGSDEEHTGVGKGGGKSRRELPAGAVAILKAWLLSPEHFTHPYPTPQDQIMLMEKTGIDKKQLKNWFTNARRRIWKPMLKKQLEAGKLAAAGAPGGGGAVQGGPGMAVQLPPAARQQQHQQQAPQQEMYSNFQQAQIQTEQQYQPQQVQYQEPPHYNTDQQYSQQQYQHQQDQQQESFQVSNSIGSLQPMMPVGSTNSFGNQMIKTDSHAVLMELFARDQDLVRQAASSKAGGGGVFTQPAPAPAPAVAAVGGGVGLQASGQSGNLRWAAGTAPAAAQGSGGMGQRQLSVSFAGDASNMPASSSFASWPHFSSVSSLSNLGGLQGVKSITNLSAADLSSQGNLNKMGNLAQVKSVENLGRGDSYAFLEVFFDDKSGLTNGQRGIKREREEDDAIGLSLDDNEASSPMARPQPSSDTAMPKAGVPTPAPLPLDGEEEKDEGDGRQLKRAYDDALAARGLIAVRKSCENLNNLDLPAKMQKTLSMEYMHKHAQGQNLGNFFSTENSSFAPNASPQRLGRSGSQNFPSQQQQSLGGGVVGDPINASVEVPSSTTCALCTTVNVDTQLRPCGHMFHGRCLKPSLQTSSGPPQCPICSTPMQSAILAVPSASSGGE